MPRMFWHLILSLCTRAQQSQLPLQAYRDSCKTLHESPDTALAALMSFLIAYMAAAATAASAARRPWRRAVAGASIVISSAMAGALAGRARKQ